MYYTNHDPDHQKSAISRNTRRSRSWYVGCFWLRGGYASTQSDSDSSDRIDHFKSSHSHSFDKKTDAGDSQGTLTHLQVSDIMEKVKHHVRDHLTDHFPQYLQSALAELLARKPQTRKEKSFMEEMRLDPTNLNLIERYASWLSEDMLETDRVEDIYNYALLIAPSSARFHYLKAEVLCNSKGKIYEAEMSYRAALMYEPHHTAALTSYGRLLLDEFNDAEGAAQKLEQAVAADPANVEALCQRARTYEACGDAGAAERTYRQALRVDPGDAEGLNNYAGLLMQAN
jgi:tetratricopeptide (TPR) repeat protein